MQSDTGDNQISSDDDVYQQAASWVAQLDGGQLSDADRVALSEWISRSPRHASEIRRLSALWGQLDTLLDNAILPATNASPARLSYLQLFRFWVTYRPLSSGGLIFASIVFALLAFNLGSFITPQPSIDSYVLETAIGEYKELNLPDGSVANLNTDTKIEVTYSRSHRSVHLIKGEALFNVAKDRSRPFQVYAGGAYVEALGTAFLVRIYDDEFDVTVTEGVVQVKPNLNEANHKPSNVTEQLSSSADIQAFTPQPSVLSAGQSLRVTLEPEAEPQINDLEPALIEKKTAWQDGLLIFDGDSLEYVLNEVARYTTAEIIISDLELRSLKMSGVFQTSNLQTLLSTLEQSFDIDVSYSEEQFIHINKKI